MTGPISDVSRADQYGEMMDRTPRKRLMVWLRRERKLPIESSLVVILPQNECTPTRWEKSMNAGQLSFPNVGRASWNACKPSDCNDVESSW